MADPILEEDSLISQDDIDNLLESSTIEEAEEKLSGKGGDSGDDGDELGELSQEDIDRLMNSNATDPDDLLVEGDDEDDDMELISQDDIDLLMNAGGSPDEASTDPLEDAGDDDPAEEIDEDDLGELSQDDIDRLMNASPLEDTDDPPALDQDVDQEDPGQDPDEDDMEMISQEDINRLMGGGLEEEGKEDVSDPDIQPDIQSGSPAGEDEILAGPEAPDELEKPIEPDGQPSQEQGEAEAPAGEDRVLEDKHIIDDAEAVDVQDCLIAQEAIDDLIQNFDGEDTSESVVLDEAPVPEDPSAEVESMSTPDPGDDPEELVVPLDTTGEDEESLLTSVPDDTVLDFENETNGDVSQDDIDALLLESDDDPEDEDDILISQDDIDTLLMAADQEDEDVLGDLMDNTSDAGMDDDFEDEDILGDENILEDEDSDEVDDLYDEDQVVLEGDDEDSAAKPVPKKAKAKSGRVKSGWLKSRLVIACVSALVVLGIMVPLSYFLFFSGEPNQKMDQDPIASLTAEPQREIEIETVEIPAQPRAMDKNPGNMILKDFIILAPDPSKEMAYITADISIDYSDQRVYHEIQGNLSFYRDLIYDSLNKSLASEKREDITETDVLWVIETTLKKVLPGNYINRVSFKSFKVS